jgi:hypothetical protein
MYLLLDGIKQLKKGRKEKWKKLREWKNSISKYVNDGGNKYVKLGELKYELNNLVT